MGNKKTSSIETIIELSPPFLKLPVTGYGGTERVVWSLVEEFAEMAARDASAPKLELWAPGDSARTARDVSVNLVPTAERAHGFGKLLTSFNQLNQDLYRLRKRLESDPSAVAHLHTEDVGFSVLGGASLDVSTRTVTTMHNLPKDWVAEYYRQMPVIAISEAQARKIQGFDFMRVVHNGIDPDRFTPRYDLPPDAPFSFLGRFTPDKNPVDAIRIAVACDADINIAGIPNPDGPAYTEELNALVAAHSDKAHMIGQVSDLYDPRLGQSQLNDLLAGSRALLFPIQWPEPFGLVIAEANACGTPVIAYNYPGSSVDELIVDGVNGFKVNSLEEAIAAAKKIDTIDRRGVRAYFEQHFTSAVMAENYRRIITQELPQYRKSLGLGV